MKTSTIVPQDQVFLSSSQDRELYRQLTQALGRHFQEECDRATRILLQRCQWSIVLHASVPLLTLLCPTAEVYWDIVGNIETINACFGRALSTGKIKLISQDRNNIDIEIEVTG
jgi:hypothetical protein